MLATWTPRQAATAHQEGAGTEPEPRQAATGEGESSRYVAQLEKRIDEKDVMITVLRGELAHRNDEIIRRNERERETNILIRGLQNLVLQLQPGRARAADVLDGDPLMRDKDVPENTTTREA